MKISDLPHFDPKSLNYPYVFKSRIEAWRNAGLRHAHLIAIDGGWVALVHGDKPYYLTDPTQKDC